MKTPSPPNKWVNLLLLMLENFKNKGQCITIDSAYMGNIMAMIGRNVWHINMVGTAQANHTGCCRPIILCIVQKYFWCAQQGQMLSM
jgi:hypothetical protein